VAPRETTRAALTSTAPDHLSCLSTAATAAAAAAAALAGIDLMAPTAITTYHFLALVA